MSQWHADAAVLGDYASGRTPPTLTASLEAHLVCCQRCRAALRAEGDQDRLGRVWDRVVDGVLTGRPTRAERLALRLGMSERDSLVVATAPRLRGAWLLAVLLCVLLGVLTFAVGTGWDMLTFLALAPLLPVGAVAFAYGQDADPIWEATLATPSEPLRLVVIRAVTVLAVALPILLVVAALLPGPPWTAAAWLLPALSCTALTLALSTWLTMSTAALGVTALWVGTTLFVAGPGFHDVLRVLDPHLLSVYLVSAVVAALVFWLRVDRLSLPGRT